MSLKNKETDQLEKKEVTVHLECLKQLEHLKQQAKQASDAKKVNESNSESIGLKRSNPFE